MNLACQITNLYFTQVRVDQAETVCLCISIKYYQCFSKYYYICVFSCPQPETLEFRYKLAFMHYLVLIPTST